MKLLNAKKKNRIKTWYTLNVLKHAPLFTVKEIPPDWTLGKAIQLGLEGRGMPPLKDQTFLRVNCSCGASTVYEDPHNLPRSEDDSGYITCPCCQHSWLFFSYRSPE